MESDLQTYRSQIDLIDKKILILLSKRLKVVHKIGVIKKQNNIPPLDKKRWSKVINSRLAYAQELGLNEDFVKTIWETIHKESLKIEK